MQRTGYQLIGIRHIRIDMADICVCETFIHGQLDNGPQREGRRPPLIGKCFRGINAAFGSGIFPAAFLRHKTSYSYQSQSAGNLHRLFYTYNPIINLALKPQVLPAQTFQLISLIIRFMVPAFI